MSLSTITCLRPGSTFTLRGVVRARAGPRVIVMGSRTQHLTTVTLMDSNEDTVNVIIWSNTEGEAGTLESMCQVGAVLDVARAAVVSLTGSAAERNDPVTSSQLRLKFLAGRSQLLVVSGLEAEELRGMTTVPYKALGVPYIALQDVRAENMRGKFCTLLAVIQAVMPEVVTNGQIVREVRIFDDDTDTGIIKLWESEQRRVAASWIPRDTVPLLNS